MSFSRFFHKRVLRILAAVSVVCLFADGSNITDPFQSCTTVHFEEVPESPAGQVSSVILPHSFPPLNFGRHNYFAQKLVLLDQDAPSEAADSRISADAIAISPPGDINSLIPSFDGSALHIRNRTLLL